MSCKRRMKPAEYHGDAFAAEHGSWNRDLRGGYEVIRIPLKNGKATGEYEDFLPGFVPAEGQVWVTIYLTDCQLSSYPY